MAQTQPKCVRDLDHFFPIFSMTKNPPTRPNHDGATSIQIVPWLRKLDTALRRHVESYSRAVLAVLRTPVMSLTRAAKILETIRFQEKNPKQVKLQTQAFARLYYFLAKQPIAQQTSTLQPLLLLIASRIGDLPAPQQREQALQLIGTALNYSPQLALVETLTAQLWGLPRNLRPQLFDIIGRFLQLGGAGAHDHLDIYLELIDIMQIPSCRQRARTLVQDGMARYDQAAEVRARIAVRLKMAEPTRADAWAMRFDA